MIYYIIQRILRFFKQVDRIELLLEKLVSGEAKMADTLADLDAAIAAQGTQFTAEVKTLQDAVQLIITDCDELLAKEGNQDFTAEVQAIQTNAQQIANVITAAQTAITAEDLKVNPPGPSNQGEIPK